MTEVAGRFPSLFDRLGGWIAHQKRLLDQARHSDVEAYAVLASELEPGEFENFLEQFERLDRDIGVAADACQGFTQLLNEKTPLPPLIDSSNQTILDKLTEVDAIARLHDLGFTAIRFAGTPDLLARRAGAEYAVEITRFGPTKGMKADVWDEQEGTVEQGVVFGTMSSDGKVADALWRAISDKLETKARQLPPAGARGVLWMSLGRSYIGAGEFEPPGAGLQAMMRRTTLQALATALNDMRGVGLGGRVCHLVLRLKGKSEHVYPPFPEE